MIINLYLLQYIKNIAIIVKQHNDNKILKFYETPNTLHCQKNRILF